MKLKNFLTAFALSSLLLAGGLFVGKSVAEKKVEQAKATTDIGEVTVSEVRNAISTPSALYLLPTQNYELPDTWDYHYTAVGEEDGIFINGVKYNGSLAYAGTGSAYITFYCGLPAAASEGDVVEFKGSFASVASGYSFTLNFAAQRFASTWVLALEDYDVVSLADANLPNLSSGSAIETTGEEYNHTGDAAALPMRKGYFGVTNSTISYAFQFNYQKSATGTGWFHVLIGANGTLWSSGHFLDFGFLDNWADTGHAQIKEMRGTGNNWAAETIKETGAIALGWEVGQVNLLEMGSIQVKGSSQRFIFFKVNNVLKFGEYWTLADGGMTTKVCLQYGGTDATVTNSVELVGREKLHTSNGEMDGLYTYSNICPGFESWGDYMKSVDGQGLKLNGVAFGSSQWNYFKKTGSCNFFINLTDAGVASVSSGDILYFGGIFKATKVINGVEVLFKIIFADSYFQYDGTLWHEINPNYEAGDFAKDLLKMTLSICTGEGGNNHDDLETIWTILSGINYYGSLTIDEKDLLKGAADSSIVVPATTDAIDDMDPEDALGAALYRYDYCTAKYSLTPFIQDRVISVSFSGVQTMFANNNNSLTMLLVIASSVALMTIGGLFILSKRKEER